MARVLCSGLCVLFLAAQDLDGSRDANPQRTLSGVLQSRAKFYISFCNSPVAFRRKASFKKTRWQPSEGFLCRCCCCWCWCSPEFFAHGGSVAAATRNRDAHHLHQRTARTGERPLRASLWISPQWRRTWTTSWRRWRTWRSRSTLAPRKNSTTTWSWIFWRIHQSPATTEVRLGRCTIVNVCPQHWRLMLLSFNGTEWYKNSSLKTARKS